LPAARLCQRVAFNIFLCFFLRMRLRRFLIKDPMSVRTLAARGPNRHLRRPVPGLLRPGCPKDGER